MTSRGAIFLDRDGTLNYRAKQGEYIRSPGELRLLPGAGEAVRLANSAGIPTILVTNQRWLSEPCSDSAAYAAVDASLSRQLAASGAFLDARYVCPHPKEVCYCRKPAPGMLLRAALERGISLANSVVIGDSLSDIQAGKAVGAGTVLTNPWEQDAAETTADFTCANIGDAIDWAIDWALRRMRGLDRR